MIADYKFASDESSLREFFNGRQCHLYRYLVAGNGVFLQARREDLEVSIPLGDGCDVRGLVDASGEVTLRAPRVPARLVRRCFDRARATCVEAGTPREILFYLRFDPDAAAWELTEPEQVAMHSSVRPVDPSDASCSAALIELHSHHEMRAFWSSTDNRDEQGFKLYAVMGEIFTTPTLRVRVGVYGYFYELLASEVFEMPEGISEVIPEEEEGVDVALEPLNLK